MNYELSDGCPGMKFDLFSDDDSSLRHVIDFVNKSQQSVRREKVCVVSILGKSTHLSNSCKAFLVDESLGKNIFRGQFCQKKHQDKECQVEGYFDSQNKVVFLHLVSVFDPDILVEVCKKMHKDLIEKGLLPNWSKLQEKVTKVMLLLFLISHIIVLSHPVPQFDLNYLSLFHLLETIREKVQPIMSDILREIPNISSEWVEGGRPCSPRVLFVFEAFNYKHLITDEKRREYQLYLEDQIYRFLRKSRIITNICANSLFAVCNQSDFVFIATRNPSIKNSSEYIMNMLIKHCNNGEVNRQDSRNFDDDENSLFYSFLWHHINTALTRGFDDNVGRHNIPPIFKLPTAKVLLEILLKFKQNFFDEADQKTDMTNSFSQLHSYLELDIRFSESRCSKVMPLALSNYQDGLPSHYTAEYHERKLAIALQTFTSHARGPAIYNFIRQLRDECDKFWQNGHQMCEVLSLTSNNCINPVHRAKDEEAGAGDMVDDYDDDMCKTNQIKTMAHCSGVKVISACDCGRRQGNRDDPFTTQDANEAFYNVMRNKCSCGHLERVLFPVFEPSTNEIKAAEMMYALDISSGPLTQSQNYFESQPDIGESFTNFSQSSPDEDLDEGEENLRKPELRDDDQEVAEVVESNIETDQAEENNSKEDACPDKNQKDDDDDYIDDDDYEDTDDDEDINDQVNNGDDIQLVIRESKSPNLNSTANQHSTTEYLAGMLHSLSPPGLLPRFSSWSLVCLGPSSLYSHNIGLQDQPGFISGANYLLPWDVTVKLEHSGQLPPLWEGKRPPGIKNKKTLKDGTQFTVKIFVGVEYECHRGHRFMSSGPNCILKANLGLIKDTASKVAGNDMPLYVACVCSRMGKQQLAQLMRIHVVTPKAPVHVTLNPRVQPAPQPCPIFTPGNVEPIKLSQSTYWIFRLPFIYEGDHGPYMQPKDLLPLESSRLLKGTYGIADYITKSKN